MPYIYIMRNTRLACRLLIPVLVLAMPVAGRAQVGPVGGEFQVNSYTLGHQDFPNAAVSQNVCLSANGSFLVVWESSGQDGNGRGIFAQRYDADGTPAGSEFQVNTYTTDDQRNANVCCDEDGDFVIVWQGDVQDGDIVGIFGQRFLSTGTPLGTEFPVNSYTTGRQNDPSVCCVDDGSFVVAWQGDNGAAAYDIFSRWFQSTGQALGTEFVVNTYTGSDQYDPDVCCDEDGDFVIVWESYGFDQDGDGLGGFGQRYASGGTPRGTEFQVNSYTTGDQENPDACCDANGNFVVTWEELNRDGDSNSVSAQRFGSTGARQGTEFQVNVYTTGQQMEQSICCDEDGNFIVVWEGRGGQDGSSTGVFARRYRNTGVPDSGELQVNSYTASSQDKPSVDCDPDGNFVVAWSSQFQDGSGRGVFAQRFALLGGATPAPVLAVGGLAALLLGLLGIGSISIRRRRG